jgi:hypothetical protein
VNTIAAVTGSGRRVRLAACLAVAMAWGCFVSAARAVDRVYWTNVHAGISFVPLDGSAGGNLTITGTTVGTPQGVAIDPAAGKIYWANGGSTHTIAVANLDGSNAHALNTGTATTSGNEGVALDVAGGKIYWANPLGATPAISYTRLDGSGGADLAITGTATLSGPRGIAVDPTARKIYWSNAQPANKVSVANLDGSDSHDLNTGAATVTNVNGAAVDPVGGRIYFANYVTGGGTIGYANLNGSGGGNVNTGAATVNGPLGVAVDPSAGKVYWANFGTGNGTKISYANLDGSGGGDVPNPGAIVNAPTFPALLRTPVGAGAPAIAGGSTTGSTLSCSTGSWAPDLVAGFVYRAPTTFAYQWSLGGSDIAGATQASITATAPGAYRCRVTAANLAGTASQTSAAVTVSPSDADRDGIPDTVDRCPGTPRGGFDSNNDGCPGPYVALHIGTTGGWTVSDKGIRVGSMTATGLRSGIKVRFVCKSCHVSQILTARGSKLSLKKLRHKLLRRGNRFTLTATGFGLVGDRITLTVKRYGHTRRDFVRVSRAPFTVRHACLPVGSSTTAKSCSATPPTGP